MNLAAVSVSAVETARELDDFLDLPARIYQNDPNWPPPIRASVHKQLSAGSPFNEFGEFQCFIARRNGQAVGRIVAAVNHRLNEKEQRIVGLFGFFELENDEQIAAELFRAASDWLAGFDCEVLRGPIDLSTHINCLCQIDGFESAPYFLMPYNPPYYPKLLESQGCEKVKDAYAYKFSTQSTLIESFRRGHQRALKSGITFRPIRIKGAGFEEDCRNLYRVFTESFTDNWSSTPRSEAEFMESARDIKQIADPKLFPLAEYQGQVVGFFMTLPDFNWVLRKINGKLNLIGLLKVLWYRRKISRARVLALGILPEFQRRKWALGPALIYEGMDKGIVQQRQRYAEGELSWVWEDNMNSRRLVEAAGGKIYKTYRMYEKPLK